MVMDETGTKQRLDVFNALLVTLLEADLGQKFAALQVVHGDGMIVDLGDEGNFGRIFVGGVAQVEQVVLHGNDFSAGGSSEENHVVRAQPGLDVRSARHQV